MDLGRGEPVKFGGTSTGPVVGPSGVTGVQESVTGVIVTSPLPDRTPDSNTTPARPKPDPPPPPPPVWFAASLPPPPPPK